MNTTWLEFIKRGQADIISPKENLLINLISYGLIKVEGPDALSFLQGQLTCDVASIAPETSTLGAHCDPKGRIISLFYLFIYRDSYYLLMPRSLIPKALEGLKKYAIFFKATLHDESENLLIVGIKTKTLQTFANTATIAVTNERFILVGDLNSMQAAWQILAPKTTVGTEQTWHQLQINHPFPIIYPETSRLFLPHELNLPALNAVSFSKGCYTGQEIIARMHYKGKLKKKMFKTNIIQQSPPIPGSDIYYRKGDEKVVCGTIVDSVLEDVNLYKVLIVADEALAKDNFLFIENEPPFFNFV